MITYLAIWVFSVIQTFSFILQDSYNIKLEDSAHYKIEETIGEKDLEMINNDELQQLDIDNKENKLNDLKRLASEEFNKISRKPINWYKRDDIVLTFKTVDISEHTAETTVYVTKHRVQKRRIQENDKPYDYNEFLAEYYEEALNDERSNKSYHLKTIESQGVLHSLKKLMTIEINNPNNNNGFGVNEISRLWIDYKEKTQPNREIGARCWKIMKIWFYLYLAVVLPLWCTKGWCCCCLLCKFFNPCRTIDEAKRYLIQNPPGILKTRKGQTLYEPTDEERVCYKEFEHLIRII